MRSSYYSNLFLAKTVLVATLGGLLFGYDTAVISGTIEYLEEYFALSKMQLGWVVSSALLGCMIGAGIAGVVSDSIGRKRALMISSLLFLISAIGTALPDSASTLIAFRLIGGIGVGVASVVSPMYISEMAPENIRGRLVSMNQMAILTGMLIVYMVNSRIVYSGDHAWRVSQAWRWMFGSELLPALIFFVLIFTISESPRWLVKSDQPDRALAVLRKIHVTVVAERIVTEIETVTQSEEGGWREVFGRTYRPALVIGACLAVIQHGTGINAVMYYAPHIFVHAGFETTSAIGHMVIISLSMIVFTVIGLLLVDTVGRKPLLLISSAGMATSLCILYFTYAEGTTVEGPQFWVLGGVICYVASFSIAMGPIVWVMISEIFPNRVRGRAASVAVVLMWSASLVISQFFPLVLNWIEEGVFLLCGIVCMISFAFIYVCVPETKGKTLEEIEATWQHRNDASPDYT